MAEGNARRTVRYGDHRAQVGDLWLPAAVDPTPPVLVLVHGGFWRPIYRRDLMTGMARAATVLGWAAWNVEYRRPGLFGGGGGWPATTDDVEAAVRAVGSLPSVDPARVALCGHSAGGQLALAAAAIVGSQDGGPRIVAAISLAGVLDLEAAARLNLGGGAPQAFLGGGPDKVPDRYRACSPSALLPLGVRQLVVHGTADDVVPPSMSEEYCTRARQAGDDVTYAPLAGAGHRDVIAPSGAAWDTLVDYLTPVFGV